MKTHVPSKKFEKVTVDLTDEEFLVISKMAHDKDITFNQMCNDIINNAMRELEKLTKEEKVQFFKNLKEQEKLNETYFKCREATPKIPGGIRTSKKKANQTRT